MKLFSDYPAPPGNKPVSLGELNGPSSYTQVSVAVPPTGGIQVQAKDIGLVEIEYIESMMSDDGQYYLVWTPNASGKGAQSVTAMAVDANTGAEVSGGVDLHTRKFRFLALGR